MTIHNNPKSNGLYLRSGYNLFLHYEPFELLKTLEVVIKEMSILSKIFQQILTFPEKNLRKFISSNEGFEDRLFIVFQYAEFGINCSGNHEGYRPICFHKF